MEQPKSGVIFQQIPDHCYIQTQPQRKFLNKLMAVFFLNLPWSPCILYEPVGKEKKFESVDLKNQQNYLSFTVEYNDVLFMYGVAFPALMRLHLP